MKKKLLLLLSALALAVTAPAQTRISDYTAFSTLASTDLLLGVDVSDTSMAASGTTKRLTISTLSAYLAAVSETLTNKTITSAGLITPAIVGGTAIELTSLSVRSSASAFDLLFANSETLTSDRTLTITVNNAARTLDLSGNLVLGGTLTTSGAYACTFTLTAATAVTLPTTGTLATLAGSETLTNKTIALGSNTVSGNAAAFNTALTGDDFATLGVANTFTLAQTISATTAATSSTTGALIVSGGVGIAKDSWVNGVRIGLGAGQVATDTALGSGALSSTTGGGTSNTAVGNQAGTALTSANHSTLVGSGAGAALTTGSGNTVMGSLGLYNATTGSNNTVLGYNAARYLNDGATSYVATGDGGNVFLGAAVRAYADSQADSITIGRGALSDGSNTTVIGSTATTAARIEGLVSMPDGIRASGVECQTVFSTTATSTSTTTVLPYDTTIPQSSEGAEFLTVTITPTSASSILVIEFESWGGASAALHMCVALFQDSGADALTASAVYNAGANYNNVFRITYKMTAGTTSATTFKVRFGPGSAGTAYMLRSSSTDAFSTAKQAVLRVREIRP